jgi:SRSO17 transposase
MAVSHSVDPAGWQREFHELMGRIASRFGRVEPRRTVGAYVSGLLSGVERKNCWNLAEQAGHRGPEAMQRLLRTAHWDADRVRDDVREYVHDRLGHPDGVLIVDETGFVKKGTASAGVQRQYTGTAGRIENSQVGVFLAYASTRGRALIDRRLYLPQASWVADGERCQAAGVPARSVFATKPALAGQMIVAALETGIGAAWVAGDEVYGQDPSLRALIEDRGVGYVLAIAGNHRVATSGEDGGVQMVSQLAAGVMAWHRYSAGAGAKGPRWYAWAWRRIDPGCRGWRWLLVRRTIATGELAFFRCSAPTAVPLATLVGVAGTRWAIEESFQGPRARSGWITTRSAPGPAGIGTSRWRCSLWPSSPRSQPQPPATATRR